MQNVSMAAWNLAAGSGGGVRSSEKTGVAEDSFQSFLGKTDSAAGDISAGTARADRDMSENTVKQNSTAALKENVSEQQASIRQEESAVTEDRLKNVETDRSEVSNKMTEENLEGVEESIRDILSEELGLDEDTIESILASMGISAVELLQPEVLKQFILEANGSAKMTGFLTDETLLNQLNTAMEAINELDLEAVTGLDRQELLRLIEENQKPAGIGDTVSELAAEGEETAVFYETQEVDAADEYAAGSGLQKPGQEVDADSLQIPQGLQEGDSQESSSMEKLQILSDSGRTGSDGEGASDESAGSSQEKSQGGLIWSNESDGVHTALSGTNEEMSFRAVLQETGTKPAQFSDVQRMTDIVNQVVERIRTVIKEDVTTMEMQLNPEHLGKVALTVSSRDGILTAGFIVQTQEAKEALESQMITLRQNLEQKELKVEAVEVSVAEFSFTHSYSQEQHDDKDFRQGSGKSFKYDPEEDSEQAEAEKEQLRQRVMQDNGSSIDFIA